MRRKAHRIEETAQEVAGAVRGAWWGATAAIARRAADAAPATPPDRNIEPPPPGFMRRAWREAFAKDSRAVAEGLYPPPPPRRPARMFRDGADVIRDSRQVAERRKRNGAIEARDEVPGGGYPAYYRQNFHFQTGGWFTAESARRYEAQVETLFAGAAGPMRRCALALLARAWRDRDHRGARILDLACGAGGFLVDLDAAFPRARLTGLDLSLAYLGEAVRAAPAARFVQANAERLPFAGGAFDAVTAIWLFHELPPKVRQRVAGAIARVLAPGGLFVFADALQWADEPRLAAPLARFPDVFHEPFFRSYGSEDLPRLFGETGLRFAGADQAFLTKALLFQKPDDGGAAVAKRSS